MPLIIPPGNPYNSPFGRQDYVGPNSDIFQGRGGNRPNLQGGRRPPGSRFDPLDPFGNNDFDDGSSSNDFRGFNNMGQPFGGNNNRGPFI